uniref:Uncharacterized protein n=1 Tax=Oryza sativa subsp. japonica TaxID=39947 RepID=Q2QVR8_ORYSJ|nr:hypothetical protein LOC_Os12g11880 [Oryza sativa Japonica Group]
MSEQRETSVSARTSGAASERNPRAQNRLPTTRQVITKVDASSRPMAPRNVVSRWSNCCEPVARDQFGILHKDIIKVTEDEKERAWTALVAWFGYPAEEARLKQKALQKKGKTWKNFKWKFVSEYIIPPGNRTPFKDYPQITENVWEEFCELKNTQDFTDSSHRYLSIIIY